jgi:hypothetical protein
VEFGAEKFCAALDVAGIVDLTRSDARQPVPPGHSTQIANLGEVRAWRVADTGGSIDVRFKPANNKNMTVRAAGGGKPVAREQHRAS